MTHHICHVEIPTTDMEGTKKFYSNLFGWKLNLMASMNYVAFETGQPPGGGFLQVEKVVSGGEQSVLIHVFTESIQETLARATELGGMVVKEKVEIPDMGWYALFADPEGNVIGLFEPRG